MRAARVNQNSKVVELTDKRIKLRGTADLAYNSVGSSDPNCSFEGFGVV